MSLSSLRSSLRSCRNQKASLESENATYRRLINEIKPIYNNMKDAKSRLKTQHKEVKTFAAKSYPMWKGDNFSKEYQLEIESNLVGSSYPQLVQDVDCNLDALNDKMTEYENKILQNQGIIGGLISRINSLINAIENWFN